MCIITITQDFSYIAHPYFTRHCVGKCKDFVTGVSKCCVSMFICGCVEFVVIESFHLFTRDTSFFPFCLEHPIRITALALLCQTVICICDCYCNVNYCCLDKQQNVSVAMIISLLLKFKLVLVYSLYFVLSVVYIYLMLFVLKFAYKSIYR